MVTQQVEKDVQLRWDAFLEQGEDPALRRRRAHIEHWIEFEWPAVRHELATQYHWEIPEGLMPHWAEPGTAIYWQEQKNLAPKVIGTSASGAPIRVLEPVSHGWKPTSPLPANNASQIDHYLRKGLRLRPPVEGVDVEALRAAVPADALQAEEPPLPARVYECRRHLGKTVFTTWKAYIQHCNKWQEPIEEAAPPEVLEMARKFRYYCHVHHKGFNHKRLVERHIKSSLRRPGRSVHLTAEQMVMTTQGEK